MKQLRAKQKFCAQHVLEAKARRLLRRRRRARGRRVRDMGGGAAPRDRLPGRAVQEVPRRERDAAASVSAARHGRPSRTSQEDSAREYVAANSARQPPSPEDGTPAKARRSGGGPAAASADQRLEIDPRGGLTADQRAVYERVVVDGENVFFSGKGRPPRPHQQRGGQRRPHWPIRAQRAPASPSCCARCTTRCAADAGTSSWSRRRASRR